LKREGRTPLFGRGLMPGVPKGEPVFSEQKENPSSQNKKKTNKGKEKKICVPERKGNGSDA